MQKHAFTPDEWNMIKRYLVGGLQVGAGAGLLQAAGNYVHGLGQEVQNKTNEDDDTLFVRLPSKSAMVAAGVGLSGGVMTMVAANAAVRRISQMIKRKRVQEELDQAQQANLHAVEKVAADGHRPLGLAEGAGGAVSALAILAALSSGAITYASLGKAFPQVKKPANPLPKRVKILPSETPEDTSKVAAFEDPSLSAEFVIRMALAVKSASDLSSLPEMVAAVAQGRLPEMIQVCREGGADAMFSVIKGASDSKGGALSYDLAVTALAKSASLRPLAVALAGAELYEAYPGVVATGAAVSPEDGGDILVKFASAAGLVLRHAQVMEPLARRMTLTEGKQAADSPDPDAVLRRIIAQENEDVEADPQTVKEHLYRGELLSGISGETVDDVDHRDSNDEDHNGQRKQEKDIEEIVMGV